MKKAFLLIQLLAIVSTSIAQQTFLKTYYYDYPSGICKKIVRSADNNNIIISKELVYPSLIKMKDNGDTVWIKSIYTNPGEEYYSIVLCDDGGFMIAGAIDSTGIYMDFTLLKVDSAGNPQWEKHYGTNLNEYPNAICRTRDHGFIVAGTRVPNNSSDFNSCIMRFDSIGGLLWAKAYQMDTLSLLQSILQVNDGGFIAVGEGGISHSADMIIMKIDSLGQPLITKSVGDFKFETGTTIIPALDSGYVICGSTDRVGVQGRFRAMLMNIDDSLNARWTYIYGATTDDRAQDVIAVNNHYVFTGITTPVNDHFSWLIETNSDGSSPHGWKWNNGITSYPYTVCSTFDGGYLVGGDYGPSISSSDLYFAKLNSSLVTCTGSSEQPPSTPIVIPSSSITPIVTSLQIIPGTLSPNAWRGGHLSTVCQQFILGSTDISPEYSVELYPNPSSGNFTFSSGHEWTEFNISDLNGKILISQKCYPGLIQTSLQPGIYILTVSDRHEYYRKKLVIQ